MISLIPDFVWVFLGGLVAAVAAFFFGEAKGKSEARRDALEADVERSKDIERKADEAREHFVDRHPVDRLRDAGRIRD